MLTIKAEIKKREQKNDGSYNVKLRFTLNRKVKRLSTSLFVTQEDLTKTGTFRKNTPILKEINSLVLSYQAKCNAMEIDLHNYSLDDIFRKLKFKEQQSQEIDFIKFASTMMHGKAQDYIASKLPIINFGKFCFNTIYTTSTL